MAQKNPAAVALGRLGGKIGGKSRSAAKVAAARENGKKGGRPRMKIATKFHKDGSVSYWSVYEQIWKERVFFVPAKELAAMPGHECERVIRQLRPQRPASD